MNPKASDQKRKRGRPPGASKSKSDASSHEAPDHDAEPDLEERARPKKRGRKSDVKSPDALSGPSRDANGPSQPPRVGRPKKSQQTATADVQPETERQDAHAEAEKTAQSKGKGKRAPPIEPQEEQPDSSEPRRSGRARGGNPKNASSAEQSASSPDRSTERVSTGADEASTAAPEGKEKAVAGKRKETVNRTSPQDSEPSASGPRRRGRGRPTKEPDGAPSRSRQDAEQEAQSTEAADNRKSGSRASGVSQEMSSPEEHQNDSAAKTGKKRRGRPLLNKEDSQSARALQLQKGNRSKAPKQSSEANKTADESPLTEESSRPTRRGRPRRSDTVPQEPEEAQPPRSRGRPRREPEPQPEPADADAEEQEQEQEQAHTRNKRGKRQPPQLEQVVEEDEVEDEDEDASSEEDEQEFPFQYLRESIKNISRSVISEKWNALDGPSISAVGTFLADAQRPVLLRLQNTSRRREHAATALSGVSRRLHSKLVKGFPFPAPTAGPTRRAATGSHEDEFDFERAMNAVEGLENTLNPLLHSISLLEREIKKEEDALARDYDSLHKLEANARSEAKGWREKAKREHVLASGIRRKGEEDGYGDEGDRLELVVKPEDAATGGLFEDLDDEELVNLSKQIGKNMESMQGNLQQVDGVVPAISSSKAALQQLMQKHLDEEQYDRVLLG